MSGNSREQNKEKIKKLLGTIIHYNNKLDKKISFNLENILSAGNFAVIVRAKCIEGNDIIKSNEIYALKFLFKNQKQTNAIDYLREKTILYDLYGLYKKNKEINYIMKLFGDFELSKNGDDYYILITEFCQGINLENIIYQCNLLNQYLDEILVLKILKQLLECLNFLHNKCHIIHRDIKPDNIILGNDNNIKLIDFGLSAYLEKDDTNEDTSFLVSRKSVKGCAQFTAPEILYCVSNNPSKNKGNTEENNYSYSIDIFSLGFTIYNLMNPKGNLRNLPEIIINKKDFKREKVEINNNYYSPWLVQFIKKFYIHDMDLRPSSNEALQELNGHISQYNIDMNKKIHVTYLNNIDNNFNIDVLYFLKPSNSRQIKLITSMKSLMQVLYKLDVIKNIKNQMNNFNQPENYNKTLLYSFLDLLDIMSHYEDKKINRDIYENSLLTFINQTFRKNKSRISGIIPSNLFFMLLSTFSKEIYYLFPNFYNHAFDEHFNTNNKTPFSSYINIPHENDLIDFINNNYKANYKGPFVDNFFFILLQYQQCDKCKHISLKPLILQLLGLNVQNEQEKIQDLINRKINESYLYKNKCLKCGSINVKFIKKNYFLNLPNYLVLELEDKNKIFFDEVVNIPLFNKKEIKYEFVSCIFKNKSNNISKYNSVIKNKGKNIFEICDDDNENIISDIDMDLNVICTSIAIYKKIS